MRAAFAWGFAAAATLVAGGAFVLRWPVGTRTLRMIMAFGSGDLLIDRMGGDTTMPEAFEHGGELVGVVTTFGFALAFAISSLE